jgi:hypothetical protein
MWEIIVGVVVKTLEFLILGGSRRGRAEPQGNSERRKTGGTNQAAKHGVSSLTKREAFPGNPSSSKYNRQNPSWSG